MSLEKRAVWSSSCRRVSASDWRACSKALTSSAGAVACGILSDSEQVVFLLQFFDSIFGFGHFGGVGRRGPQGQGFFELGFEQILIGLGLADLFFEVVELSLPICRGGRSVRRGAGAAEGALLEAGCRAEGKGLFAERVAMRSPGSRAGTRPFVYSSRGCLCEGYPARPGHPGTWTRPVGGRSAQSIGFLNRLENLHVPHRPDPGPRRPWLRTRAPRPKQRTFSSLR